jgi:phosphopantetheinyl transferase
MGAWEELPLQLARGSLGQPLVLLNGLPILSVSFSLAGGRIWGALAGAGRIGIDVAFPSEFPPDYPRQRVFSQEEFDRTRALVGDDPAGTAALLWVLKEAGVKALGVGFTYLAPREIVTGPGKPWRRGYLFEVDAGSVVKTWARPEGEGWLALALTEYL